MKDAFYSIFTMWVMILVIGFVARTCSNAFNH